MCSCSLVVDNIRSMQCNVAKQVLSKNCVTNMTYAVQKQAIACSGPVKHQGKSMMNAHKGVPQARFENSIVARLCLKFASYDRRCRVTFDWCHCPGPDLTPWRQSCQPYCSSRVPAGRFPRRRATRPFVGQAKASGQAAAASPQNRSLCQQRILNASLRARQHWIGEPNGNKQERSHHRHVRR